MKRISVTRNVGHREGRHGIQDGDERYNELPNHSTAMQITNLTSSPTGLRFPALALMNNLCDSADDNLKAAARVVRDVIQPGSKMPAFVMTYFLGFSLAPLLVTFPVLSSVVDACAKFIKKCSTPPKGLGFRQRPLALGSK